MFLGARERILECEILQLDVTPPLGKMYTLLEFNLIQT
jgi:hypothetical protein